MLLCRGLRSTDIHVSLYFLGIASILAHHSMSCCTATIPALNGEGCCTVTIPVLHGVGCCPFQHSAVWVVLLQPFQHTWGNFHMKFEGEKNSCNVGHSIAPELGAVVISQKFIII